MNRLPLTLFFCTFQLTTVAQVHEPAVDTGNSQPHLVMQIGHSAEVLSTAISANGRTVVTGGDDDQVIVWEVPKGREIRRFQCNLAAYQRCSGAYKVAISHDGFYAAARDQCDIWLWKVATGESVEVQADTVGSVRQFIMYGDLLDFSPDGRYLAADEGDSTRFWDVATGREVRRIKGVSKKPWAASGLFRKTTVGTGDGPSKFRALRENGKAYLCDVQTGERIPLGRHVSDVVTTFSPDNRHIVVGDGDSVAHLWDLGSGQIVRRFVGHSGKIQSVDVSLDGKLLVTASMGGSVAIWELDSGRFVSGLASSPPAVVRSATFSPNGRTVLFGSNSGAACLFDVSTGDIVRWFKEESNSYGWVSDVAFSSSGKFVATADNEAARIWKTDNGAKYEVLEYTKPREAVAFSRNERYLFVGGEHWSDLWDLGEHWSDLWDRKEKRRYNIGLVGRQVTSVAFSPDGKQFLTGNRVGTAVEFDIPTSPAGGQRKEPDPFAPGNILGAKCFYLGHSGVVTSVEYSPDGSLVLTGSKDGTARLWKSEGGDRAREVARLISFGDGTWMVMTPDGRFDTNNLDEIRGLHWVMPDDPMRTLSPEIFMRDYYEPRLLPRVLSGAKFKTVRSLAALNRVQPGVEIVKIKKDPSPDAVSVTVEVSGAERTFQQNRTDVLMKTRVYDLRLFRDGRLVGQCPEPQEATYKDIGITSQEELSTWRKAMEIPLDQTGKARKTFTVRLPRRKDLKEVEFTAYAFNEDRVKSQVARQKFTLTEQLKPVKGCAYIIAVGVSGNEDMHWRLSYAAEDAKLMQKLLTDNIKRLTNHGIDNVVPIPLITVPPVSDLDDAEVKREREAAILPTKENIKAVLDLLAGRNVDPNRLDEIPSQLRRELRPIRPEDVVILSFSSHGVTDTNGEFYILPYDLGESSGGRITTELLKRSISSQELSVWLCPLDAEQMFMVIDACHSAAAVDVEGFKPGPMGNPGLGQLSYDKKMPILTATQATDSAWAKGYSLLTYALAKEAIGERQLELADAMRYAEARVPKLYEEVMGNERKGQLPKLFEFGR